jgi:phosphatidate cytidylyltransferase
MLALRVMTALVLAPVFLAGIFFLPPVGFALFIGVFLLLSAWEWGGLCDFGRGGRVLWSLLLAGAAAGIHLLDLQAQVALTGALAWIPGLLAVIAFPAGRELWRRPAVRALAGLLMLLPAWAGLVLLQARTGGAWLVLWTMVLVWAADIGGYFAGRAFGRRRLAPEVSPGKTLEGLAGGVLAALVVSVMIAMAAGYGVDALGWLILASIAVIAASVVGDLMESLVKRVAGVKDSGTLLPGHGGILDRVDAVLAAAPVAAVLLTALEVVPGGWLGQWFA